MRYSSHEQRQMDMRSGEELDRNAERKVAKQVDIHRITLRVLNDGPGYVTYGVWINGDKSGDLVVRQEERVGFEQMMARAGFVFADTLRKP